MIAIIDYDSGNIRSVEKALDFLGEKSVLTRDEKEILNADKVILPGVGAFKDAMDHLEKYELCEVIKKAVALNKPILGICLGLQLLFEESEESPNVAGLGILKGKVKRIPDKDDMKIPHIGWNSLQIDTSGRLFKDLPSEPYVYFVHSYYLEAEDKNIVKAKTYYNCSIDASVESNNIFACQFHPEKSGKVGLKILKNFANL